MKKLTKASKNFFFLVFIFGTAVAITSCSNNEDDLDKNSTQVNFGTLARSSTEIGEVILNNKKFVLNKDNSISKFTDDILDYNYSVNHDFSILSEPISDGYKFTNDYGEIINVRIGERVSEGKSLIDIEIFFSNGDSENINDVIIDDSLLSSETMVCAPCVLYVIKVVVESVTEALSDHDNFETACRKTLESVSKDCVEAGGKPNIDMSDGWFGRNCRLECR